MQLSTKDRYDLATNLRSEDFVRAGRANQGEMGGPPNYPSRQLNPKCFSIRFASFGLGPSQSSRKKATSVTGDQYCYR